MLDLINPDRSHCYNPFVYLESDDDIQRLTTNIIKNTTPKGSQTTDPFWDQAAEVLLKALVFYLYYEAPPEEQNFPMVIDMIRAGDLKENDDDYLSPLDMLFAELEEKNPEHIALKYYRGYHSGAAQTLKSIQISLIARLEKLRELTDGENNPYCVWNGRKRLIKREALLAFILVIGLELQEAGSQMSKPFN